MTKQRFGMVLPITLLAYFLILMDNSIIFTSATEIGQSLNLSSSTLSWVSNAYLYINLWWFFTIIEQAFGFARA
ncbi:MFS family permease [Fructobacillus cardui]|uniref:hypothetical protein n=1 Tax=Fructobacillus cardui TaxID=2893170 RepID=UPI002D8BE380|nr:MFS family permease [Fructobacillus cardui]